MANSSPFVTLTEPLVVDLESPSLPPSHNDAGGGGGESSTGNLQRCCASHNQHQRCNHEWAWKLLPWCDLVVGVAFVGVMGIGLAWLCGSTVKGGGCDRLWQAIHWREAFCCLLSLAVVGTISVTWGFLLKFCAKPVVYFTLASYIMILTLYALGALLFLAKIITASSARQMCVAAGCILSAVIVVALFFALEGIRLQLRHFMRKIDTTCALIEVASGALYNWSSMMKIFFSGLVVGLVCWSIIIVWLIAATGAGLIGGRFIYLSAFLLLWCIMLLYALFKFRVSVEVANWYISGGFLHPSSKMMCITLRSPIVVLQLIGTLSLCSFMSLLANILWLWVRHCSTILRILFRASPWPCHRIVCWMTSIIGGGVEHMGRTCTMSYSQVAFHWVRDEKHCERNWTYYFGLCLRDAHRALANHHATVVVEQTVTTMVSNMYRVVCVTLTLTFVIIVSISLFGSITIAALLTSCISSCIVTTLVASVLETSCTSVMTCYTTENECTLPTKAAWSDVCKFVLDVHASAISSAVCVCGSSVGVKC
ncbi:hypothetical protein Pelo_14686 [Pelomyxa schiedti]|nr:hypothetical protein Pelo_14686 [Pelomyxa schiedti]